MSLVLSNWLVKCVQDIQIEPQCVSCRAITYNFNEHE